MSFDRVRSRIFLALGLGGALATGSACGSSRSRPDAAADSAKVDAPKTDAAMADAAVDASPTVRRPFLVGGGLRTSMPVRRADWCARLESDAAAAALDEATRGALARAWQQDALEEHASVAAFSRFALHMLSVGAPPDLVQAAHRAALDEVQHARLAFALAARYAGRDVGPAPLGMDDAFSARSLAELAELAAEEGCVGETLGAILAGEQARLVRDPVASHVLHRLARDEAEHAAMAWRFARWAVETGGQEVAHAIARGTRRACAGTLAAPRRHYAVDLAAWHAHGRVTCDEAHAVAAAGIRDVVEPALQALLATPRVNERIDQIA